MVIIIIKSFKFSIKNVFESYLPLDYAVQDTYRTVRLKYQYDCMFAIST